MECVIALERQRDGIADDKPCRQLFEITGRYQRVDLQLNNGRDVVAVLSDQLTRDLKGQRFVVVVAHSSNLA